ncbi:DUF397 domain-containing protein [Saccharopolyspora sp. HNM0986]|uniref:DUF397 domain-containing protein n=1 Tax=Saccharopolyspora galaxeae TaxID=2781241 RepID=UPI00190AE218|nr:DUF397 domain-containing protein [Saccharopolyspora sp. HNM0986]MBK0865405.1 DUF397 domain-containing protein [Saccharopolyspora sp. HNM0986]
MTDTTGAVWRKSGRSGGAQQCVEVATNLTNMAMIRDSKLSDESPIIKVKSSVFAAFIGAVKGSRFNG